MKRTFDFTIALICLILFSPLIAVIALAIWLSDFHIPFYAGVRMGRGTRINPGRLFRMIKFRSMRPDAWKSGVNSTAAGDSRITPIGRLLRRSKLDELPQLWNVLIGDMSFVGPRPQVPADAALYTKAEQAMLTARPGITDLASIVFADEGEILAGSRDPDLLYNQTIRPWKSRLALLYVDRQSLPLDLRILLLTASALASRRRALDRMQNLLLHLDADPLVILMAARRQPLLAYPPPGSDEIVSEYSNAAVAG